LLCSEGALNVMPSAAARIFFKKVTGFQPGDFRQSIHDPEDW
jgi:hypothetical protein